MKIKFDIGNLDENGGWAISADIGRLSVIAGDLVGQWGLRVAWYTEVWAYFAELTTGGWRIGIEKA
jgi:hypothetical protein